MKKKTKQIASGLLITGIIGTTTFTIIDPYNIFSGKVIEKQKSATSDKNEKKSTSEQKKDDKEILDLKGIKDGIYVGASQGNGGDIKVEVTIENGKIKNIKVLSHSETPQYYENGSKIITAILKENTVDVDTISGATFTSNGIKNAVKDALKKAGFRVSQSDVDNVHKNKTSRNIGNRTNYITTNSIDVKQHTLKDGEFIGQAVGFGGAMKVKVIVKNGKLIDIQVLSHQDDAALFNRAKGLIIKILNKQSTANIDTVTGATYSSRGIINAVNTAVQESMNGVKKPFTEVKTAAPGKNNEKNKTETTGTVAYPNSGNLKDGEFISQAAGFGGAMRLKVIIQNGKLMDIQVLSHQDDTILFNKAKSLIKQILNKQSTVGIDTVTGATYSSKGIIDAVHRAVQDSKVKTDTPAPDKKAEEPGKDNKNLIDKSKLKDAINKQIYLRDKTYTSIKLYLEKKANAERILAKDEAQLEDVNKALMELDASIKGLKTSLLRPDEVYEVNTDFAYKTSRDNGSHLINGMLEKTEVKLNDQGKIDVTMIFNPKKGNTISDDKSKFIIKDGEDSQIVKPVSKDGLEIFNFTLSDTLDSYAVELYVSGSDSLSGNSSTVLDILWKTMRLSGTTASETNPLKPGNEYTVFVEMRNFNSPNSQSMANTFLEKPSTISVDRKGVARLTFRMKEKIANTRIYTDKTLSNPLRVESKNSNEVTFVLPTYNKEGWVWGTSHIEAMKMDVKFGLKIDWATLNNSKGNTETWMREGIVSGAMGSLNRSYAIQVSVLLDREKDIFKDLIVTQDGYGADDYYLKKATEEILKKIKDKTVTLGTIQSVDSVSGATLSSKGIKEAIISAVKERIDDQNKFVVDFVVVGEGTLEGETVFNLAKEKTWKEQGFKAPTPVANEGYFFDRWTPKLPADDEVIKDNVTYKAIFIKKANKQELHTLIAKEVDKKDKAPNVIANYEEKLKAAKVVAADEKAKQTDVDKAKQDLEVAMSALHINLKVGAAYEVTAKFYDLKTEINAVNTALQKMEIKLNEENKLEMTMVFKDKPGYSFTNKGIFKIKEDGKAITIKPEVKEGLEIFNFTLPTYRKRYDVVIKLPSSSIFGRMATSMEILWDTIKPV